LPTLSMFYGIVVQMNYRNEHNPPHIHAVYQGYRASYDFDGNVTAGEPLPRKQHRILVAWIELHRDELEANWTLAMNNEPIYPIAPLAL